MIKKSKKGMKHVSLEQEMEESVDNLFKKYDKILIKWIEKKCKDYCYSCISCKLWDLYERFKKDFMRGYMN